MENPIEAIYENGVFRPIGPVDLPEHTRVRFVDSAERATPAMDTTPEFDSAAAEAIRPEGHFPVPWTQEDDQALASLPPERRAAAIRLRRLAGCLAETWSEEDDRVLHQIAEERRTEPWRELPE